MYGFSDVIHALENENLSSALSKLEFFAISEGHGDLATWARQERSGDFSLVSAKDMPKYRNVIVIWRDSQDRMIKIEDHRVGSIYNQAIPESVQELEQKVEEGIRVASPGLIDILHKQHIPAAYFDVSPTEIRKVLASIRNEARLKLAPVFASTTKGTRVPKNTRTVFIVHGRNEAAVNATKHFLSTIGLESHDFSAYRSAMGGTVHITDVVRKAFSEAQAIIVLWTPDEYAALNPGLVKSTDNPTDQARWQPRPNVIFEAGAALLEHPDRTIVIGLGRAEVPSDMSGLHLHHMSNAGNRRSDLRAMLTATGCEPSASGSDYLRPEVAGDFESCVTSLEVGAQSPFRNP